MKLPTISERDELIALYRRVKDAQEDYKLAAEAVAGRTGGSPASLRKYVQGLARDEADKVRSEAQEVLDLFEAEAEGDLPYSREVVDAQTGEIISMSSASGEWMRHDGAVGGHG